MLTLQILDSDGETYYHPLHGTGEVIVGSAPDVDVRITDSGVAPRHARIQPNSGRRAGFKVVDLGSDLGTKVNGESVLQARLSLGDRIEFGGAVVVVGKRVSRPATAVDVLDHVPISKRGRRATRTAPPNRSAQYAWIGGGVLLGLIVCVVLYTQSNHALPPYYPEIARKSEIGEFQSARRLIVRMRDEWAGSDTVRRSRVDSLDSTLRALERAVVDGRARIRREAATQIRSRQFRKLRTEMKDHPSAISGRAARILLAELDSLRDGVQWMPSADGVALPGSSASRPPNGGVAEGGSDAQRSGPTIEFDLDAALVEVRRLRSRGRIAAALDAVAASVERAESDDEKAQLELMRGLIRDSVQSELESRLARSRREAAGRTVAGIDRAIDVLGESQERLPGSLVGDVLERERARLRESRAAAARAEAATAGVVSLAEILAAARDAEVDGRFREAGSLLEAARDQANASSDPKRAADFDGRRVDVFLLEALQAHLIVRARATAGVLEVPTRDGPLVRAHAEDGRRLTLVAGGAAMPWGELLPVRVLGHAQDRATPPMAVLGAAVLAYRAGQRALAEGLLARHATRSDLTEAGMAGVIARGRDDRFVDARGYRLVDGQFVAVREIDARKVATRVAASLAAAIKRDVKQRDRALEKILAEGPQVTDAVVLGLRRQLDSLVKRISAHRFKSRVWDELEVTRAALDQRRTAALDLIFDTERYFFPYKQPAVSSERAADYRRVQAEIDERVAAVTQLWHGGGAGKRIPTSLAKDIERLRWLETTLSDFGEAVATATRPVEWIRTLPAPGDPLGLRNFCRTPVERIQLDEHERIRAYNSNLEDLSKAEAEQALITNDYRGLLGRAPLAISLELQVASRGHADEMTRLGYFSHYSPTPGRKNPFDRMKLAGYEQGVSENLAQHPNAKSAHAAWTHSAGHHRNLLGNRAIEIGIGQDGRYWVQNFGSGETFRGRF